MFEDQEHIVDAPRLAVRDQLALKGQRLSVRDPAQTADDHRSRHASAGSQFSIWCFKWDMNSSAIAPSMSR